MHRLGRPILTEDPERILERGNQNIGEFVAVILYQVEGQARILRIAIVLNNVRHSSSFLRRIIPAVGARMEGPACAELEVRHDRANRRRRSSWPTFFLALAAYAG
ncbi:hypothetical protein SAMCCGM7_Ch3409 [Sinorhizobium americanum CCGM7]|nr:hypothetical protein SAMCCGM7_Ch3409 [Sinorhizobium americanum CCGM7]